LITVALRKTALEEEKRHAETGTTTLISISTLPFKIAVSRMFRGEMMMI
jgi:hypothetical protein